MIRASKNWSSSLLRKIPSKRPKKPDPKVVAVFKKSPSGFPTAFRSESSYLISRQKCIHDGPSGLKSQMFQKGTLLRADFSKSIYGKKHLESVSLLIPKSKSRIDISLVLLRRINDNQRMLIGYARVSTAEQNLDLQTDALTKAGCEKIFTDTAGGAKSERSGLTQALSFMREGDTLVVWKLDRLGRSLKHLIETVLGLQRAQKGFRSLQENIDTSTSGGKLFFHIFGALAEFERDIIRDRTMAGLASARSRGRLGGRPSVMDAKKIKMARSLYADAKTQVVEICEGLGISRATFYRHIVRPAPGS